MKPWHKQRDNIKMVVREIESELGRVGSVIGSYDDDGGSIKVGHFLRCSFWRNKVMVLCDVTPCSLVLRNILPSSSVYYGIEAVGSSRHCYPSTRVHGLTSQKMGILSDD